MSNLIDIEYVKRFVDDKDLLIHFEDEAAPGELDSKQITPSIDRAHSIIYSFLYKVYQHPFTGDEFGINYLKDIEFRIAQYFLFNRFYKDDDLKAVKSDYERAYKELFEIETGKRTLDLSRVNIASSTTQIGIKATAPEKKFYKSDLETM